MKPGFKKIIYLFSLFAASLLAYRIIKSGSLSYIFLAWNLFLAFVPYWLSNYLLRREKPTSRHLPLFAVWLLFLPNAPYILTDLFHFRMRPGIPLWFDLVLVSSFALIGFALFYRSLADMIALVGKQADARLVNTALPFVFGLVAYGLYLGRYLRFNSWDVVQHPLKLAHDSVCTLLCKDTLGFVLVFGTFMWFIYVTLSAFNKPEKN